MTAWLTPETSILLLTLGGVIALAGIVDSNLNALAAGGCTILAGWIAGMVPEDGDDPR